MGSGFRSNILESVPTVKPCDGAGSALAVFTAAWKQRLGRQRVVRMSGGLAAWDSLSNRQEMFFFFFFWSFPPPSSRDAALTRDQRLFLCACVKATKVNATSLGSGLHSHRMGVNGLLSQLNIP